jgi:hypothetical protein
MAFHRGDIAERLCPDRFNLSDIGLSRYIGAKGY